MSHNNFSDILASEMVLALKTDVYLRSIDLRNNNISEKWCSEFLQVFEFNLALTNIDLRLNDGFTNKMHRELALRLLKNI